MKQVHQLPLIYHPTNVLFLDDEETFLNRITLSLDDRIPYVKMTDPSIALNHLKKRVYQPNAFSALLTCQNFEQVSESESTETFDIDFSKLVSQLNQPERFQKIAVVFVDQVMAKIKGLDFCRKVREANLPVKLVLLTGNTEEDEVIDAFNKGLINAYLPKNHPQLSDKISEQIFDCCAEQFIELSQQLLGFISPLITPLYEKGFLAFFNELLKERNFFEFYLIDSTGSFLLLDDSGKASLLMMYQEDDFAHYYDIAEDDKAPENILNLIRTKKKMPIKSLHDKCLSLEGSAWPDVMHDCHQIAGKELYYSLVDEPAIDTFGFKRYVDQVWLEP